MLTHRMWEQVVGMPGSPNAMKRGPWCGATPKAHDAHVFPDFVLDAMSRPSASDNNAQHQL
eukprot:7738869-Pyramimonas_sp.AAC.1